jgi:hypothetical protein
MTKNILIALAFGATAFGVRAGYAKNPAIFTADKSLATNFRPVATADSVPLPEVVDVVRAVIYSLNTFNIDAVSNLYTPNAVIADDDPPFSWNGPTAGVQWVNAVEQACKNSNLTKLRGKINTITVFHQTAENYYIVVPVRYTGNLPDNKSFSLDGAFAFVLRLVNGKWMIKSQVWIPRAAM